MPSILVVNKTVIVIPWPRHTPIPQRGFFFESAEYGRSWLGASACLIAEQRAPNLLDKQIGGRSSGICEGKPMMNGLKIRASITERRDGCRVTVSMTQDIQTRELVTRTVPSRGEAETIGKAFALLHGVPWYKVEVSSG
jgi:hypothetical protein